MSTQASALAIQEPTAPQAAAFAGALDLVDVSNYDLASLSTDDQIELHEVLDAQIPHALEVYTQALRPLIDARAALKVLLISKIAANGAKELVHPTFHVRGKRSPKKVMDTLIKLVECLPADEVDAAVFVTATISDLPTNPTAEQVDRLRAILPGIKVTTKTVLDKSPRNLSKETVAELKAAFPGVYIELAADADGTKLNALLKRYGPESEIGKIIREGYAEAGPISLEITPRESAMKVVS